MNTESAVITAVCENKDISTILAENVDEIFTSHRDIWEGIKSYYAKYKSVPDVSVVVEKFKDFEPEIVKGATTYYVDRLKNYNNCFGFTEENYYNIIKIFNNIVSNNNNSIHFDTNIKYELVYNLPELNFLTLFITYLFNTYI